MAVLKYITRGEQTAQGKQKAYFCAHPDDYGRYFEKVSETYGTSSYGGEIIIHSCIYAHNSKDHLDHLSIVQMVFHFHLLVCFIVLGAKLTGNSSPNV